MPHYFQRYSSKENWVTNATLLLLSRINHHNPRYFQTVINRVLGETIEISTAVEFQQQQGGRGNKNVIDGLITQPSFAIAIETKLYDNQDTGQLIRHLESLRKKADVKILLALSVNDTDDSILEQIREEIKKGDHDPNIKPATTTYQAIIDAIQEVISPSDLALQEILDDYTALCDEHNLLNTRNRTMLAVPVNKSFETNLAQNIYYHAANRRYNRPFTFIGFYSYKKLRAVGRITLSVIADLVEGQLVFPDGRPAELTNDQEQRIRATIESTEYYNLHSGMKFYLLQDLVEGLNVPIPSTIMKSKYFVFDREPLATPDPNYLREQILGHYEA